MNRRLTAEHGFWAIVWLLALGVSLYWDAALGRIPDWAVTLFDVTSLTLCLAVGCRVQMRRSNVFRCWASLIIYLTTHWMRDWFLVLLLCGAALPSVGLFLTMALPHTGIIPMLVLSGLLTATLPTWKLVRNVRLLRSVDDPNERWVFRQPPRWVWN